jgi:hypothetical protein
MKNTLASVGIVLVLLLKGAHSQDNAVSSAVSYCQDRIQSIQLRDPTSARSSRRTHVQLSEDQTTLCFDGKIDVDQEMTPFRNLRLNGRFVIRSPGGYGGAAMEIANILREKDALIVLYDYCLSACANYILIASGQAYVVKDTIVAWHGGAREGPECNYLNRTRNLSDRNEPPVWMQDQKDTLCKLARLQRDFFQARRTDDAIIHAPQSHHTRKMLKLSAQLSGYRDWNTSWMWNPKHYGNHFKTRIIYESYPDSQEEVDAIMSRNFGPSYGRVITIREPRPLGHRGRFLGETICARARARSVYVDSIVC